MILDTGKSGELVNVMLTCCRSWVPESIKASRKKATSHQSVTYQGMAPFITSICFAASSHNTTRWISLAFLIDMFSSSSSSSFPYSIYFLQYLSLHHISMMVSAKEVVISPLLNLAQDTCLLRRMRCVMKASFLWENWLSTVTSFPSFKLITVAFPITPVLIALAWVSWQKPLWSGWAWRGSIVLKTLPFFRDS